MISLNLLDLGYGKIPKISPGAYIFQRPFLRSLFLERLVYGGKYAFQLIVGSKFTIFLCFLCIWGQFSSEYKPRGSLYLEGWFNGGFFASQDWGAYIWRGFYMEGLIFGILRYLKTKLHLTTPLQNSEEFVKNQALINLSRQVLWDWSKFAKWCTRGHVLYPRRYY